jgi:hypothetical protein
MSSSKGLGRLSAFPTGAFIVIVGAACLGLGVSAAWDFVRLSNLRVEYLRNTAEDIAAGIDAQLRGPSRRSEPTAWQSLFAETIDSRGQTVAFVVLLDRAGRVLASEGDRFAPAFTGSEGFVSTQGTRLYIHETDLPVPRPGTGRGPGLAPGPGPGMPPDIGPGHDSESAADMGPRLMPARLRIGVYTSSAEFIRGQAIIHLAMNGVAIVTLLAVAIYFLRTLNRFLPREQNGG